MVRWLAKAAEVWRRREPPPPQPYDLGCKCGQRISGVRQANFLVMRCNRCGEPVFVLPADVYPKPKPKKAKKRAVAAALASAVTQAAPKKSVSSARTGKALAGTRGTAETSNTSTPAAVPAPSLQKDLTETSRALVAWGRSVFSPFRLIVTAIAAVVAVTGYFAWQSHLKEQAALTLAQHVEQGDDALRQMQLDKAADEYRQAARAVDRLGRDDPESLVIRQKAKELDAMVHLSQASLYDICNEAGALGPKDAVKWNEKFRRLYRNSWVIIEGDLVWETGADGRSHPVIRYPFPIGASPVILDAGLKALKPLAASNEPTKVIFAGQLESFEKEGSKNAVWVIRFNDATAFLWTDAETYRALELDEDDPKAKDETSRVLDRQAAAIGAKP